MSLHSQTPSQQSELHFPICEMELVTLFYLTVVLEIKYIEDCEILIYKNNKGVENPWNI